MSSQAIGRDWWTKAIRVQPDKCSNRGMHRGSGSLEGQKEGTVDWNSEGAGEKWREKIRDTQECFPEQWELDPGAHTIHCSLSFCLAQFKSRVWWGIEARYSEAEEEERVERKKWAEPRAVNTVSAFLGGFVRGQFTYSGSVCSSFSALIFKVHFTWPGSCLYSMFFLYLCAQSAQNLFDSENVQVGRDWKDYLVWENGTKKGQRLDLGQTSSQWQAKNRSPVLLPPRPERALTSVLQCHPHSWVLSPQVGFCTIQNDNNS